MDKADLSVCSVAFHLALIMWTVNVRCVAFAKPFLHVSFCFLLFLNDFGSQPYPPPPLLTGKIVTVTSATVAPSIMTMEPSLRL